MKMAEKTTTWSIRLNELSAARLRKWGKRFKLTRKADILRAAVDAGVVSQTVPAWAVEIADMAGAHGMTPETFVRMVRAELSVEACVGERDAGKGRKRRAA
jgi:hypothetical protein